jgi:hypothetical protein
MFNSNSKNSIQFLFICELTQQPQGSITKWARVTERNKHTQSTEQGNL